MSSDKSMSGTRSGYYTRRHLIAAGAAGFTVASLGRLGLEVVAPEWSKDDSLVNGSGPRNPRQDLGETAFGHYKTNIAAVVGQHPRLGPLVIASPELHVPGYQPVFYGTEPDPGGRIPPNKRMANPLDGTDLDLDTPLSELTKIGFVAVDEVDRGVGFPWLGVVMVPKNNKGLTIRDLEPGQFSPNYVVISTDPFDQSTNPGDLQNAPAYSDGERFSFGVWDSSDGRFRDASLDIKPSKLVPANKALDEAGLGKAAVDIAPQIPG